MALPRHPTAGAQTAAHGRVAVSLRVGVLAGALAFVVPANQLDAQEPPPLRGTTETIEPDAERAPPPPRSRIQAISSRPYRDGGTATRRVDPQPLRRSTAPELTPPPEPVRRRTRPEDDPYAPLGLDFSLMRIRPALEFETGFDSNPNRSAGTKKGSARLSSFGELRGDSDWSRHAASFSIRGGYSVFTQDRSANRPELDARANLRLDARRDTTIDADATLRVETLSPQSTALPFATAKRPIVTSGGVGLGVTQRFNRFSIGLRGNVERSVFGDAETGLGTLNLSDRNFNTYRLALRLGYELTPGIRPFLEARVDQRRYDSPVDASGFRRSSDGLGFRAGTTFELTRLLTGEISAGYETRRFADPALSNLRGLVGEASLVWSATPLTTVSLRASSSLDETSVAGLSGAQTRRVSLQVDHAFRRWLTGTALVSALQTDYGSVLAPETTLSGTLRLDYKLSRTVVLRTSFTHERFTTATPGRDYTANVALIGLRLQR